MNRRQTDYPPTIVVDDNGSSGSKIGSIEQKQKEEEDQNLDPFCVFGSNDGVNNNIEGEAKIYDRAMEEGMEEKHVGEQRQHVQTMREVSTEYDCNDSVNNKDNVNVNGNINRNHNLNRSDKNTSVNENFFVKLSSQRVGQLLRFSDPCSTLSRRAQQRT